jgi:hypothetical protein
MGRHSAGGDDEDDLQSAGAVIVAVESSGRHSRAEDVDSDGASEPAPTVLLTKARPSPTADTAPMAPIKTTAGEANWSTAPIPAVAAPAPQPAAEHEPGPTARDFALFREHSDVRNRAIAAVLAPFVVYAVVMVATDRTGVFLIWLWTPVILAGVLMGLILDLGHKRYGAKGSADRP